MRDALSPFLNRPLVQDELEECARTLANAMAESMSVFLQGDLGSGKSTFARAFIQCLTTPNTPVPSPTFTLFQEYDSCKGRLIHADLYRLGHSDEVYEIGLLEYLDDPKTTCLIEWPDRLPGEYSMPNLLLRFTHDGEQHRQICMDVM